MVKVVEKSLEEIAEDERMERLINIAKETISSICVNGGNMHCWTIRGACTFLISIPEGASWEPPHIVRDLHVYPPLNKISVKEAAGFKYAMRIAEAFEASGEPEFTVKKEYQESPEPVKQSTQ